MTAALASYAATAPAIPVFATKYANAWPKPKNDVRVDLMLLGAALTTTWTTDAHFAAYTTTEPQRLNNDAIGHKPIDLVYFVADVDDPVAHAAGAPARDEWRRVESDKTATLRSRHPGVVVYGTKGGHRIVATCDPFPITSRDDAHAWWTVYGRFTRYLRGEFGIIADPTCKDFGRLYRLPSVRRDGVDVTGPFMGNPNAIERLDFSLLPAAPRAPHPYVRKALRAACDNVRTAADGTRNDVLNRETYALAGFIPGGYLDEIELADRMLSEILANGGDDEKDARKIADAIEAGKAKPRDPPVTRKPVRPSSPNAPEGGGSEDDDPDVHLDGRPVIEISHEIEAMTTKASDSLSGDPRLFKRDCELVHVTRVTADEAENSAIVETEAGPRRELVEGTPRIHTLGHATLKERLSTLVQWLKFNAKKKKYVYTRPDGDVVAALIARKTWPSVRPIVAIAESPFLRPDGSICQTAGYDRATARLYLPSIRFLKVPEHPTQADAAKALAMVADLFVDFPHEKPAHRMVPIAHVSTLLARPAITGCTPVCIYDANTRGSGKSLQTDTVAIIATGRSMPRMNYAADETEQEKILGGLALEGAALFSLDNISSARPFGGAPLERAVTTPGTIKFRILGVSETPSVAWLAVACGTGNNVGFTSDMVRRVLVSRLESLEARPEDRTEFKYPRLLEYIETHRAELVVALLTMLRAFVVAGRPKQGIGTWGTFESWTELVAQAIVFAGGANVLDARIASDAASSPKDAAMVAFLMGMATMRRKDGTPWGEFTSAELFDAFFTFTLGRDQENSAIRAAIEALCTGRVQTGKAIGTALAGFRHRVFACGSRYLMLRSRVVAGVQRWSIVDAHTEGST